MNCVLVIDAGTTAFKAAIFDRQMRMRGVASREFPVIHPASDRSELQVEDYWQACVATVHDVLGKTSTDADQIAAVAVTSHTDTLFVVDEDGRSLAPAIFWVDPRAHRQAEWIQQRMGRERIYRATGQTGASAVHFASRLSWFVNNHPHLVRNARYFLQTQDFLIHRLCGKAVIDHSVICGSLLSHLTKREYWHEMTRLIDVEESKLSRIIAPGQTAGHLLPSIGRALHLPPEIPVVAGAMDATAAAVAMGNVRSGVVTETTGAALVISTTIEGPVLDPQGRLPCFVHGVPGKYLLMPWCETAGSALKWYRDQFFCSMDAISASGQGLYDLMTREAADVPAGSNGLTFLPYFTGSGSPDFNPEAKAVIYGLTLAHQRKDVTRALLESVAFMLKQNLDLLAELGLPAEKIMASGGGSRSSLWCQIKADVTGLPVFVPDLEEATATGCAILCFACLGSDLESLYAQSARREYKAAFEPRLDQHAIYRKALDQFLCLTRKLRALS